MCVMDLWIWICSEIGRKENKRKEWVSILFRYEAAHSITGAVSLLNGVTSQHTWTTQICCCLQCLWQRWQTSLCVSEKPDRHNAEWKFGAAGTVGIAGSSSLRSCEWDGVVRAGGKWPEPQLGFLRHPSGVEAVYFTLGGSLALWRILQLRLLFLWVSGSYPMVWGDQSGLFSLVCKN